MYCDSTGMGRWSQSHRICTYITHWPNDLLLQILLLPALTQLQHSLWIIIVIGWRCPPAERVMQRPRCILTQMLSDITTHHVIENNSFNVE